MARMNSTNLYVTTNQIVVKANPANPSTWQDLYRLVPYLRNSLCCVVCGNLLVDPQTPFLGRCQHHLCKKCVGGRKRIKPACTWCKECKNYTENKHLKILLQCYKRMCMTLVKSSIFRCLLELAAKNPPAVGVERGAGNLVMLIREGAAFQDHYQSNAGLSKSAYSILPCVYTNTTAQTLKIKPPETKTKTAILLNNSVHTVTTRPAQYSVMYAGTGNKITIKRKPKETVEVYKAPKTVQIKKEAGEKPVFKKPPAKSSAKPKKGCRCGNATATPGKLTCCGQRCPCYVESKACIECKCRGCRNPHTPDGHKLRPILTSTIPTTYTGIQLSTYPRPEPRQEHPRPPQSPLIQGVNLQLDANLTLTQLNQHFKTGTLKVIDSFPKVSPSLPQTILMNELTDDEDDDITVDI